MVNAADDAAHRDEPEYSATIVCRPSVSGTLTPFAPGHDSEFVGARLTDPSTAPPSLNVIVPSVTSLSHLDPNRGTAPAERNTGPLSGPTVRVECQRTDVAGPLTTPGSS